MVEKALGPNSQYGQKKKVTFPSFGFKHYRLVANIQTLLICFPFWPNQVSNLEFQWALFDLQMLLELKFLLTLIRFMGVLSNNIWRTIQSLSWARILYSSQAACCVVLNSMYVYKCMTFTVGCAMILYDHISKLCGRKCNMTCIASIFIERRDKGTDLLKATKCWHNVDYSYFGYLFTPPPFLIVLHPKIV